MKPCIPIIIIVYVTCIFRNSLKWDDLTWVKNSKKKDFIIDMIYC